MKNRHAMVAGVVAVLLIGGLFVASCGPKPTPTPTPKPTVEPPKTISMGETETLVKICASEGAGVAEAAAYTQTSGMHPIVFARRSINWTPDFDYHNPWNPSKLAEAQLVACIVQEGKTLEKCNYTLSGGKSGTVVRIQIQTVVTLREAQTGKVVAISPALKGSLPAECSKSELFSGGETSKVFQGSAPVTETLDWLRPYVKIE
jgi:hypothetical protein